MPDQVRYDTRHMNKNWKLVVFILVLTGGAVLVNWKKEIKKGLDLAGGTSVVLQADMGKISNSDRDQSLDSLKSIIERRVNLYGVAEPVIQTVKTGGDFRLNVELAGVTDINQALSLIGKTAQLSFYEEESSASAVLTGKDLLKAQATFDPNKNEPVVALTFNSEGAKKWEALTKKNLNKKIIILLDDKILLAPTVISVITDGKTIITGGFTAQTAKDMATLLNSGALPAPVKVLSQKVIPATLGKESIDKSLLAGAVGLVAVAIFMIISYGKLGLVADLALIIYALLTLAIFKLIPVTLTLASIAGFILSIGMAVDANILIFERMKEETRWEDGFRRAFPSIKDSNISSLITCGILYWFGTGPIRGFAVTLAIGIVISLFTAVTVTKTFLRRWKN